MSFEQRVLIIALNMKKNMIIVKLIGGLGNQLFQYATAKAVAIENNIEFKLDIRYCKNIKNWGVGKYLLDNFDIEENISKYKETCKLGGCVSFLFRLRRKLKLNPKRSKSYFPEKETCKYDKNIFKSKDMYLDGFWQHENYFKGIRHDLIKDFTIKNPLSDIVKMYKDRISKTNSVALHVRNYTKDDANLEFSYGKPDIKYYKDAVDIMHSQLERPFFFIFSNDIVWCKENLGFIENKLFIDATESALDDFELMKYCNHNIISNSTFSWWAAWLNDSDKRVVLAPKHWFVKDGARDKRPVCSDFVWI
jgi:hypothetical protein